MGHLRMVIKTTITRIKKRSYNRGTQKDPDNRLSFGRVKSFKNKKWKEKIQILSTVGEVSLLPIISKIMEYIIAAEVWILPQLQRTTLDMLCHFYLHNHWRPLTSKQEVRAMYFWHAAQFDPTPLAKIFACEMQDHHIFQHTDFPHSQSACSSQQIIRITSTGQGWSSPKEVSLAQSCSQSHMPRLTAAQNLFVFVHNSTF